MSPNHARSLETAGALMAALKNSPYGRNAHKDIREAFDRVARQAVGCYCGLTGVCGIVPAVGACSSVFLGAHCGTDREQQITMEAATRVSRAIADLTGPSCCKAYVRSALSVAVTVFGERFGVVLPASATPIICTHSAKHPHGCREEMPLFQKTVHGHSRRHHPHPDHCLPQLKALNPSGMDGRFLDCGNIQPVSFHTCYFPAKLYMFARMF